METFHTRNLFLEKLEYDVDDVVNLFHCLHSKCLVKFSHKVRSNQVTNLSILLNLVEIGHSDIQILGVSSIVYGYFLYLYMLATHAFFIANLFCRISRD